MKTRYHVLRSVDNNGSGVWTPVADNIEAGSAKDALRATIKESGQYVAIPSRSFTPTTVTIETKTQIKIGGTVT